MTSASELADAISLMLLQWIMEGMESGQFSDIKAAQVEVDAALAELNKRRLFEGSDLTDDLGWKMILEIASLREEDAKCEPQVAECQSCDETLKEETIQIIAPTEACDFLVEQQQQENGEVLAATQASIGTPLLCRAPVPSPVDPALYPAPSRIAVGSFPGSARTTTIHSPPNYQSTIRDDTEDVITTRTGGKPIRREGAFGGLIKKIGLHEIHPVSGRGPDLAGPRPAPPTSYWPDRSRPSPTHAPSRSASDIIARQRQLSVSIHTDVFGRVLPAEHHAYAKSSWLPTGMPSSQPSEDTDSGSSAKPGASTPCLRASAHFAGRGKKRAWHDDADADVPDAREGDYLAARDPTTPTPVKREAFQMLEVPSKRKKPRLSASSEALSVAPLSRSHSALDLTLTD